MPNFSDIFGQSQAIDWLRRAYLSDRLPHGLVFAGPVGVGKATTAKALSKLFLCENPNRDVACGSCPACRAMEGSAHPDYHVITRDLIRYHDKTGKSKGIDLSIHVLRPELVEPASRKSVMGRGKVFLVEQAELMNAVAQNALLKTLEEPAGRTLIILLTDQPGALLPTIRSRTQTVLFGSLTPDLIAGELKNRQIAPDTAKRAAKFTRGSLGLALQWIADEVIDPATDLVTMIDGIFAGESPDALPGWFKKAAEGYAEKQLKKDELGSKDAATREGLSLYLNIAAEHIRQRLSEKTDPNELNQACNAIDAIARAENYLDGNVNVSLIFQQLAVALGRASAA